MVLQKTPSVATLSIQWKQLVKHFSSCKTSVILTMTWNDLDEDLTEALDVTCGNYKPVSVDQARALYIWLKDELEQILYN